MTSADSITLRFSRVLPCVRPHGISHFLFLIYPCDLHPGTTVVFWALLLLAYSPVQSALVSHFYQRRATIFAITSFSRSSHRSATLCESLSSSSTTTPYWDFHPRAMACPSYKKKAPDFPRRHFSLRSETMGFEPMTPPPPGSALPSCAMSRTPFFQEAYKL